MQPLVLLAPKVALGWPGPVDRHNNPQLCMCYCSKHLHLFWYNQSTAFWYMALRVADALDHRPIPIYRPLHQHCPGYRTLGSSTLPNYTPHLHLESIARDHRGESLQIQAIPCKKERIIRFLLVNVKWEPAQILGAVTPHRSRYVGAQFHRTDPVGRDTASCIIIEETPEARPRVQSAYVSASTQQTPPYNPHFHPFEHQ